MKSLHAIALVAGLSCVSAAGATPPLQLVGGGIRVEPIAIAPAWIENGKIQFGDWQDYAPVDPRDGKAEFYVFDCFGGFVWEGGKYVYANYSNAGRGGGQRAPYDYGCGMGSSRWYFGADHTNPMIVEDVQTLGSFASGGGPIDGIDDAWYWGGGTCVMTYFTSNDSAACNEGDPLSHDYLGGVAFNFGSIPTGGYYYANLDGVYSQFHVFVPMPSAGGSYLKTFSDGAGHLNTNPGTQGMLWGTGDANNEPYRAGTQTKWGWYDHVAPFGSFGDPGECEALDMHDCPTALAYMMGFLQLSCPADVNRDGFVNGSDYDDFASAFDVADRCADLNGDGFVNGDDFDAFADWFDQGC